MSIQVNILSTSRAEAMARISEQEEPQDKFLPALFRSVADGNVCAAFFPPGASRPDWAVAPKGAYRRLPVIALLMDYTPSKGPGSFPAARGVLQWANFHVLKSANFDNGHVAAVLDGTAKAGRVAIIDVAGADNVKAWMSLLDDVERSGAKVHGIPAGATSVEEFSMSEFSTLEQSLEIAELAKPINGGPRTTQGASP
jgi:hypothetical protein